MFEAPHGAVCAALLPHVMDVNIRALSERDANGPGLSRYDDVARIITGNSNAKGRDSVEWVGALVRNLQIPGLGHFGIRESDISSICEKAAVASSMKANPITLTKEELREILQRAL